MKKIFLVASIVSCTNMLNISMKNKGGENEYLDLPTIDVKKVNYIEIQKMLTTIFNDEDIISNGTSREIEIISRIITKVLKDGNENSKVVLERVLSSTVSNEAKINILMVASSFCKVSFVDLLLKLGMDPNYIDKKGITSLTLATSRNSEEGDLIVEALIKARADKDRFVVHLLNNKKKNK